jgi:hypothetical protein
MLRAPKTYWETYTNWKKAEELAGKVRSSVSLVRSVWPLGHSTASASRTIHLLAKLEAD